METLTKTTAPREAVEKSKSISAITEFLDDLETNRFGFAPMILIAMACLGGIAAAFAVNESDARLMAVAITTTFVEVLVIAVAPMRMVALATVIAFLVDLYIFIF